MEATTPNRVAKLRIVEETADPHEGTVPVDVVARRHRSLASQVVGEGLLPGIWSRKRNSPYTLMFMLPRFVFTMSKPCPA
jgi:hypothetical protein